MKSLSAEQLAALDYRWGPFLHFNDDGTTTRVDALSYRDTDGDTVLHSAAITNDVEAASWLLAAGADPNAVGDMGQTALHWAVAKKNKEMADLLLSFGAKTDVFDEFGERPDVSVFED